MTAFLDRVCECVVVLAMLDLASRCLGMVGLDLVVYLAIYLVLFHFFILLQLHFTFECGVLLRRGVMHISHSSHVVELIPAAPQCT